MGNLKTIIVQAAKSYLEDLETGLEDGTYEEAHDMAQELKLALDELNSPPIRVYPQYVCKHTGSTNVGRDAWAVQDEETGEWVLGNLFDQAYIFDDPDGETTLVTLEEWEQSQKA